MNRFAVTYNYSILICMSLIALLSFSGVLAYGNGLGDIIYASLAVILVILQLIITMIIFRRQKGGYAPRAFYICGTIFLLFIVYLSYHFTVGRGGEYAWDGHIFFHKN